MSDFDAKTALFRNVMERYARLLRRAIARACPPGSRLEIEDIEQDARLRLWKAIESEREIAHPASFLYRVGTTATLDAVRRAKARRRGSVHETIQSGPDAETLPDPGRPGPERIATQRELLELVRAVLRTLPGRRRRAVALHLQGLTTSEVALVLGWTEPKARNLVYRGLKTLRDELRSRGIDHDA